MVSGTNEVRCRVQLSITEAGVRGLRDLTPTPLAELVKASLREYAGRFPNGRAVPLPEGVELVITTDLALATYMDLNGCPIVAIRPNSDPRAGRHQSAEFVCADYDGASGRVSLAFVSSKEALYNSRMGILKKEAIRIRDLGRR